MCASASDARWFLNAELMSRQTFRDRLKTKLTEPPPACSNDNSKIKSVVLGDSKAGICPLKTPTSNSTLLIQRAGIYLPRRTKLKSPHRMGMHVAGPNCCVRLSVHRAPDLFNSWPEHLTGGLLSLLITGDGGR